MAPEIGARKFDDMAGISLQYIIGGRVPEVLVTTVEQMALGPVSCPEKIHCIAVFTLQNGKFFKSWGVPLRFILAYEDPFIVGHDCY